jgi:Uncharacterized conserved protein (DUF2190)
MSNTNGHKMADGNSVDVTVPGGTVVAQGEFVYLDKFFGLAEFDDKPVSTGSAVISINIERAQYDTDQITVAEAFNVGDLVNFNSTTKLFTVAAVTGAVVGPVARCTIAKNADNVIGIFLLDQRA